MEKQGKMSLSVGIPAYNEARNIAYLLSEISRQRGENFDLVKIIVVADDCTDRTEEIVRKFAEHNPKVRLWSDGKRRGKAQRLNLLYELNVSDVLITLDADVRLEGRDFFEKLLEPFQDKEVAVVGGNARPLAGKTFIEKVVVAKDKWWYEARKNFKGGDNIYNSLGQCFALRSDFAKSLKFLPGTINDQEIIFLETRRRQKKFAFAKDATLRYREAANWKELVARARRFEHEDDLANYGFGSHIAKEYYLPYAAKMKGFFGQFARTPLYAISSLVLALTLKLILLKKERNSYVAGLWQISESTKEFIRE